MIVPRVDFGLVLNVLFTRALASRIPQSSPLLVNTVNPGFCKSSLLREVKTNFILSAVIYIIQSAVALSTEQGGRTLAHAALVVDPRKAMNKKDARNVTDADARNPKALHGKFLGWTRIMEESDFVLSDEGKKEEERLWVSRTVALNIVIYLTFRFENETVEILSAVDPRVQTIVKDYLL